MAIQEFRPPPDAPPPDPYAAWRLPGYRLYAGSWFLMTMARQIEFLAVGVYLYGSYDPKHGLAWDGKGW